MKQQTVFITHDFFLPETLDKVQKELESRGIKVIRGPETIQGKKLVYRPDQYEALFGRADVAVFSSRSICSREVMEAAPRLRGIVNPTIGVDTVDVAAATELGIIVGNGATPENYLSMAESTILLMLMLLYNPIRSMTHLKESLPQPSESQHWAQMMLGKTIGILGMGRIGRAIAERLQGWNVRILAYDPYVDASTLPAGVTLVDLDTIYKTGDLVCSCLVVTDETRGMFNDDAFARMKPSAYFINTARGQLVNEEALCRALETKQIAGAALDTFQAEPLPADSPLRGFDNVILTPHLIGHTVQVFDSFPTAAVENITSILAGNPPPLCVNPQVIPKWRERIKALDAQ